jgi:hypothetical protein
MLDANSPETISHLPVHTLVERAEMALQTTRFNLDAALNGAPFIHRYDATRPDAAQRVSTTIIPVSHPKHAECWLAYCGEWVVFDAEEEMARQLLLVVQNEAHR